jgi:DNA-binding MarR family transcriptional regulator
MVIAYEKFRAVRRMLNLIFTQNLKHLAIGPKQAVMLRHVDSTGKCSLADLSRATSTDPAAVNRAVASMISRGLIQRQEHESDHRCWQVSLTEKGRKMAGEIDRIYGQVADVLVAPLNNEERQTFLSLLDKVADSITAAKPVPKKELAAKH